MRERDGRDITGKWEVVAETQSGSQWMENYEEETSGVRGLLAKPTQQDSY